MTSKLAPRARATMLCCALASLSAGCGVSTPPDVPPASPPRLVAHLESAPALDLIGAHSEAEIVMRLPHVESHGEPLGLEVDYGEAIIGARGPRELVLEELLFAFERVDVPAERLPPRGLSFDEIRLRLVAPASAHVTWASTTEARAIAVADLELDWLMVLPGGQLHRLGTEHLEGVEIGLRVLLDAEERVIADLDLALEQVWHWAGLVELQDLDVHLVARQRRP